MSKTRIIENLAARKAITNDEASQLINEVFTSLLDSLDDGKVMINDFGIFDKRTRAARIGRNIRTGEEIHVAEKQYIRFREKR